MAESENDLISRTIRFLNQQKEMYGDFSVKQEESLATKTQNHEKENNEVKVVSEVSEQEEVSATESQKHENIEEKVEADTSVSVEEVKTEYQTEEVKPELTEAELIAQCSTLEELKALCEKAETLKTDLEGTNLVFGVGNPNADLMIIGEAPGFNEDKQGEPFVGEAGQLLDKIMAAINFKRDDIYIANILKHRPPENRDPKVEERANSLPYLLKQIELVDPKLILCVGRVSGTTLLGKDDSLKNMRSKFHEFNGRELMVTYHPAALLRNQQWKRPTWEDVQKLRKRYDELGGKP
ncbi:uracil-DNA glycosylase [Balneola sp. EhC07]|uniref:uracil-DNA glycosylase n=1 Tax=Balneola sp. EhC07 TaxID=1849360 RepID=UPI000A8B4124|nr:uracil-DNA glycosylase [Balneola sp. EhC07]